MAAQAISETAIELWNIFVMSVYLLFNIPTMAFPMASPTIM
jgi:hypothetical protein